MKKISPISLFGLTISLAIACDTPKDGDVNTHSHAAYSTLAQSSDVAPPKDEKKPPQGQKPPETSSPVASKHGVKTFAVHHQGITLNAEMNSFGEVKILDYPTEWHGQVKIIRYDGHASSPFSKEHCLELRQFAKHGGGIFIRTAHHSIVEFSMPFFLTYEFNSVVGDAAEAAGLSTRHLYVVNPVQVAANGSLELRFNDDAISPKIGELDFLYEQLHFRYKGIDEGDRRVLTVFSGDILCDLVERNVEMIMSYTIDSDERKAKVIYNNLEVASQENR